MRRQQRVRFRNLGTTSLNIVLNYFKCCAHPFLLLQLLIILLLSHFNIKLIFNSKGIFSRTMKLFSILEEINGYVKFLVLVIYSVFKQFFLTLSKHKH